MKDRLSADFYRRTDPLLVARELLGKLLVTEFDGVRTSGRIVEAEAYRAPDDSACHAYKNRRTPRTEVMFAEGGVAYIYLCYGIHHLFNVVTGEEGMAHAVLIRAVEPVEGVEAMLGRRRFSKIKPELTAGPGSVGMALGLKTSLSGASLLDSKSPVWIEDIGSQVVESQIVASPRVGCEFAGESAFWPWRFSEKGNQFVSRPRPF